MTASLPIDPLGELPFGCMIVRSRMAKPPSQVDVLVLGDHPSAYLAAMLLQRGGVPVAHSKIPGESLVDRLVLLNPSLFELDDLLRPLKRRLDLSPVYGLKFIADDPAVSNLSLRKTIGAYIGSMKQIQSELAKQAKEEEVLSFSPQRLTLQGVDEQGVHLTLNEASISCRLLILAGTLPLEQQKLLGLPPWGTDLLSRYTFLPIKASSCQDPGSRPMVTMSLNLRDTHHWAWLFTTKGHAQLAIEQPVESSGPPSPELLQHWLRLLQSHGLIKRNVESLPLERAVEMVIPLGGALNGEGVANRTLCIGPAGGFFTACAEDVYPSCWSAICAAEVARSALKERHLQDALQAYRQRWGATLGDYLRGPQQNLRFLLPLVYRNPTMASRLTDAILSGKSVVR